MTCPCVSSSAYPVHGLNLVGLLKEDNAMRSILVALAAAAAFLVVSVDGYAADYELVGITSATFASDQGVHRMTEGCQAEFGADTRMCRSVEVIETVN